MSFTKTSVSKETISVLDDQYRYVSTDEVENAKWLDLDNVMSVKRGKTIYAIRARNTYNFTGKNNTHFFSNSVDEYRLATQTGGDFASGTYFTSNIYRGFGTATDKGVANNIFEVLVYGNVLTKKLEDTGVGGSLSKDFAYGVSGHINVQSNVAIYGNLADSGIPISNSPTLNAIPSAFGATISGNVLVTTTPDGTTANVNGNATCFQKVQYYDSAINPWNRLINANIAGKIYVNASTDPCDFNGVAVNNQIIAEPGTAFTNEAFRHQFQLKANINSSTSLNPIYVARISRFGQRLSDNKQGAIANNLAISSFSSNFFASIPSDNSLYAGRNLISDIYITGNIVAPQLYVFNDNFTTGQLYPAGAVSGNFNGNVINVINNNNNSFWTITKNESVTSIDGIKQIAGLTDAHKNIIPTGTFQAGDSFNFVQANVLLTQGFILMDRIAFTTRDPNFVKASNIFSQQNDQAEQLTGNLTTDYNKLWFSSTISETSSQYFIIKGVNLFEDKWNVTNLMSPSSLVMPSISNSPNLQYFTKDTDMNVYLRRGDMSMVNYTYVDNKTLTGVKYISTVPGFINNVTLPSGNITLSANVLENGLDLLDNVTTQISLPIIGNASDSILANISCNYNILFSGNVNVENRVDKRANLVCPVNFDNSFIANCWNYNQDGMPLGGPGKVISNVSIIYGENKQLSNGQVVKALRLDSDFANVNITYDLEFKRVIGQSNSDVELTKDNYVFYANLNSTGLPPSKTDTNISSSLSVPLLDNNQHINGMCLQGVAYSEYNFSSLSSKFMDVGLIKSNISDNNNPLNKVYNSNYILPTALVQTSQSIDSLPHNFISKSDSYLNLVVDYNQFNRLSPEETSWHELTFYNVAYRYAIDSVSVVNGSTFNNNLLINGEQFDSSYLYSGAGRLDPSVNGNIEASAISCYVYENLGSDTSAVQPELLYPFTIPVEGANGSTAAPAGDLNALFPGYKYTTGTASAFGFNKVNIFATKSESDCDLILPSNSDSELGPAIVKIIIQCQDKEAKTFKVGLSTEKCQIVSIKPVPHGRGSNGTQKYATPIVCAIDGEPNSYVIIMVECKSGNAADGLADEIAQHMPVSINVAVIEKNNGKHQLTMDASLRVFDGTHNNMSHTIVNDFLIKTSIGLKTTYVNSTVGSFNQTAQLGINIFSIPSNGSILSFVYSQKAISRVLSYTRFDYTLTPKSENLYVKVNETSPEYFASSVQNQLSRYEPDGIFPAISPNSTRYYIDMKSTGIFIDIANDTNLTDNIKPLIVGRSVEWVLTRSINNNEIVGRGLLSKMPSASTLLSSAKPYNIYENLTQNASGYLQCITTNLINLASRCIMQKFQTKSSITNGSANKNNWQIKTLGDQLNVMIVRINGSTGRLFDENTLNSNKIKDASVKLTNQNQTIDLGSLFGGVDYAQKFVSLQMGPIRGFGYNKSAAKGEVDVSACMFGLTIQPDNYCLVNLKPDNVQRGGTNMNFQNVLFSEKNTVKPPYLSDFSLSFQNASLAYQYLNSSSPLSKTSFTVIGSYFYKGEGNVEIYTKEFTSNYNNILNQDQQIPASGSLAPLGDPTDAAWQVDNITNQNSEQKVIAKIENDGDRFYFLLQNNRVYFRKGVNLPLFNNKKTLLLYTGLRPLVLNVLEVANASTLQNCITSASKFNWEGTTNIFTSLDPSIASALGEHLSNQYYQVVLTNASAASASATKSFNYRSLKFALSSAWFNPYSNNNLNRNFFGVYRSVSDRFQNLRLNIERVGLGSFSTTYNLQANYLGLNKNSQANESKILNGQFGELKYSSNVYQTFQISSTSVPSALSNNTLGFLFNLSVVGPLGDYSSTNDDGFRLNILPAQMSIYTAIDANNNGEIDNHKATNVDHSIAGLASQFGLENMFSEMNIVIPAIGQTSYGLPTVLSSWELTRGFNSIKGCPFDIKLNNRWSVGYNLDCYFTINTATSAQFDVITVSSKASTIASTNIPDGSQLTNLEVRNAAPLYIKNQNDWARGLISDNGQANNSGAMSGLTFKLKNAINVIAGTIVRLFVNSAIEENVNEWTVTTANTSNKSYQLYSYDQERYAALLDEQLSINNNFA